MDYLKLYLKKIASIGFFNVIVESHVRDVIYKTNGAINFELTCYKPYMARCGRQNPCHCHFLLRLPTEGIKKIGLLS